MNLTIPAEGIEEIRSVWSGRGGLWAGVAAVHDEDGFDWSHETTRRRANRVCLELLRPHLLAWPASTRQWIDALPAQSIRQTVISDVVGSGVDWVETRKSGWPPTEFHHRQRSRVADTILVTVTRWTIEQLARTVADVDHLDPDILGASPSDRVETAVNALDLHPLAAARPALPTRNDLAALRSSGRPWRSVAAVAGWLRSVEHDPSRLARLPIDPDPALADRLFHVATLGCLLRGVKAQGWTVNVTGLPGSPDGRPQFEITDPAGDTWDVWFEMAGAWSHYGVQSPYPSAVAGITGTGGPLGADIALVRNGDRALVIECKYSSDPTYVGRNGYQQTLAYMTEARSGLAGAVAGIVVGPLEVVESRGHTTTAAGPVTVTSPFALADVVTESLLALGKWA